MIKFGTSGWRGIIGEDFTFETVRRKAMGAINFTASHNPPEYNGLKFSTANGAPALPEVTQAIEREIHALEEKNEKVDVYEKSELIETIDPKDRYLGELRNKVDTEAINKSGLRIAEHHPGPPRALPEALPQHPGRAGPVGGHDAPHRLDRAQAGRAAVRDA